MTKRYYREILEDAIKQAKVEYERHPNISLNESIYNQLIDIKKTVVEQNYAYTEDESRKKYPLGIMVVRNFEGYLSSEWDYPKKLIDIAGGVSRYHNMSEE